ncbi:MAG: IMP cyclohydrolase [Deltaproteobacteria bacterium]|nr:IMP cyclohydrolase [Deltaproteobacteria bacterium]
MSRNSYRQIQTDSFPNQIRLELGDQSLTYEKQLFGADPSQRQGLRYGENPGQQAALYRPTRGGFQLDGANCQGAEYPLVSALGRPGLMSGGQKHPSMTNFTDLDAALSLLRWLEKPAAVIIKHNNPSGAAQGGSLASCFLRAFQGDALSAFGGVAVFNRPLDKETSELINQMYLEVVAAPGFEDGVLSILNKKPDVRIFEIPNLDKLGTLPRIIQIKSLIDGGLILHQSMVNVIRSPEDFWPAETERQGVTYRVARSPNERETADLIFGWAVLNVVSSNSVVVVKDEATVAIAGGQQSRLGVVQLAINKAYQNFCQTRAQETKGQDYWRLLRSEPEVAQAIAAEAQAQKAGLLGSSLVSDGFFPFRDSVLEALSQGVSAFAHPGGSLQDWDSIVACNENDPPAAMVFTGQRAFRH